MQQIPQNVYAQKLYDYKAGLGTDKAVSGAIMNTLQDLIQGATNIPTGADIDPVKTDHRADTKSSLKDVKDLFNKQGPTTSSLVFLGETHTNADDHSRALEFIAEIDAGNLTPNVVVFERGLDYPNPVGVNIVRESNLTTTQSGDFGLGLTYKQRSMVVGGYLALIVANGSQLDSNKILIFFGANHSDILTKFEYFAIHTSGNYIAKETRNLFSIRSHV